MPIGQCDGRPLESSKSNFPIGPHFAKNFAMRTNPGRPEGGTESIPSRERGPRTRECKAGLGSRTALWRTEGIVLRRRICVGGLRASVLFSAHVGSCSEITNRDEKDPGLHHFNFGVQIFPDDLPRQDVISRPTDSRERLCIRPNKQPPER